MSHYAAVLGMFRLLGDIAGIARIDVLERSVQNTQRMSKKREV
ncbi:MAG: hypothetical protein OXC42_08260 [Gammaproteobacteria bacterium]|nr:hypothetical protein [Gammaproteobacteria bacterium]